MGSRGRFGKYGEVKRFDRIRGAGIYAFRDSRPVIEPPGKGKFQERKKFIKIPVKIRDSNPNDADFIGRLSAKVFQIYGPYMDMITEWFQSPMTMTLIARLDKRPVGFVMAGIVTPKGDFQEISEILAIAVEPEKRGVGIGQKLLKAMEMRAFKLNTKKLILHTAIENVPANRLFLKNRYIEGAVQKGFYPAGQDAVMLYKEVVQSGEEKVN